MLGRLWSALRGHRAAMLMLALAAALAAADAVYYLAVCRPAAGEIAGLEARLAQLDRTVARTSRDLNAYGKFMEGREDVDRFKSMLASRSEYTEVLTKVYGLAKKDRMKYTSFGARTSALRQVGGLEQLSFSLPISGSYRDVRKFIYDVETSELFLNIDDLGLTSSKGGDISLTIGLSTYVRS